MEEIKTLAAEPETRSIWWGYADDTIYLNNVQSDATPWEYVQTNLFPERVTASPPFYGYRPNIEKMVVLNTIAPFYMYNWFTMSGARKPVEGLEKLDLSDCYQILSSFIQCDNVVLKTSFASRPEYASAKIKIEDSFRSTDEMDLSGFKIDNCAIIDFSFGYIDHLTIPDTFFADAKQDLSITQSFFQIDEFTGFIGSRFYDWPTDDHHVVFRDSFENIDKFTETTDTSVFQL